jgi:hypothetical protein
LEEGLTTAVMLMSNQLSRCRSLPHWVDYSLTSSTGIDQLVFETSDQIISFSYKNGDE